MKTSNFFHFKSSTCSIKINFRENESKNPEENELHLIAVNSEWPPRANSLDKKPIFTRSTYQVYISLIGSILKIKVSARKMKIRQECLVVLPSLIRKIILIWGLPIERKIFALYIEKTFFFGNCMCKMNFTFKVIFYS